MKVNNGPKRRKNKDNPYIINHNEINNTYVIVFNFNNKQEKIKVSKEIYEAFNRFELDDLKELNEKERHYDYNEVTDEYIYKNSVLKNESVEDIVEKKLITEKLQKGISMLPDIQKRRLKLYYFENKTLQQIAKIENCTFNAVKFSIDVAIKNLKKYIKNEKK